MVKTNNKMRSVANYHKVGSIIADVGGVVGVEEESECKIWSRLRPNCCKRDLVEIYELQLN